MDREIWVQILNKRIRQTKSEQKLKTKWKKVIFCAKMINVFVVFNWPALLCAPHVCWTGDQSLENWRRRAISTWPLCKSTTVRWQTDRPVLVGEYQCRRQRWHPVLTTRWPCGSTWASRRVWPFLVYITNANVLQNRFFNKTLNFMQWIWVLFFIFGFKSIFTNHFNWISKSTECKHSLTLETNQILKTFSAKMHTKWWIGD